MEDFASAYRRHRRHRRQREQGSVGHPWEKITRFSRKRGRGRYRVRLRHLNKITYPSKDFLASKVWWGPAGMTPVLDSPVAHATAVGNAGPTSSPALSPPPALHDPKYKLVSAGPTFIVARLRAHCLSLRIGFSGVDGEWSIVCAFPTRTGDAREIPCHSSTLAGEAERFSHPWLSLSLVESAAFLSISASPGWTGNGPPCAHPQHAPGDAHEISCHPSTLAGKAERFCLLAWLPNGYSAF